MCETSCVGRALANAGFEVKRGLAIREKAEKDARPQPVKQAPEPSRSDNSWNGDNWMAGDLLRKEISDLENDVDSRTQKDVRTLRQFVRDKFSVSGPYECEEVEQRNRELLANIEKKSLLKGKVKELTKSLKAVRLEIEHLDSRNEELTQVIMRQQEQRPVQRQMKFAESRQ